MQFKQDVISLCRKNEWFRHELITGKNSQVVLMSLKAGEEIGEEVHRGDQIIWIVAGCGYIIIEKNKNLLCEGYMAFIPAGHMHNIVNTGAESLRLISIYAPPEHMAGTIHKTRAEARYYEKKLIR